MRFGRRYLDENQRSPTARAPFRRLLTRDKKRPYRAAQPIEKPRFGQGQEIQDNPIRMSGGLGSERPRAKETQPKNGLTPGPLTKEQDRLDPSKTRWCSGGARAYPICIIGVMFWWRLLMIQSDPTMINMTISTPKASASTLLALSGPVVMWMKKTR